MALSLLLRSLGALFWLASRTRSSFRRHLSRDLVLEIATDDGVARCFEFRGRRAASRRGRAPEAELSLRFRTSNLGLKALLPPHGPDHLYLGMLDGTIEVHGDRRLLLWFLGLLPAAIPGYPVFRLAKTPPSPYARPADNPALTDRILREPAVHELPAAQADAWAVRREIYMMRVAAGEPAKPF